MRFLLIGFVCLAVTGCALPVSVQIASWAASGLSYVTTGRSVSDHAVSAVASRDCALHRIILGEEICVNTNDETEGTVIVQAEEAPQNSAERLRESLISLAEGQNIEAKETAASNESAADQAAPLGNTLLAVADTLNKLKPIDDRKVIISKRENGQHYLVLGRYQQLSEAEDTRDRHASMNTVIRMVLAEGSLLFQVTAGPYTQPEAKQAGETITLRGSSSPEISRLCPDRATQAPCYDSSNQLAAKSR